MSNDNLSVPPNSKWSDLGVRSLSAALLIPAVLLDIWHGGIWFELFMGFLGILMAHEWTNIAHARSSSQFALHAAAALTAAFLPREIGVMTTLVVIFLLSAAGIALSAYQAREKKVWSYVGIPYVALPVLSLVLLRADATWGVHAIMWLMLVVWATDTFAYFAGRIIGGPKLAPLLSPKKTWAGLLGGMAGAAIISTIYGVWYLPTVWQLALVAAILAAIAQAGDIFESALKRHFNVKDSGVLIPGHGGVLDRVDGLAVAGIAAAAIGFARHAEALAQGLLLW
jgi:phosphatidate cytidylyltransferase